MPSCPHFMDEATIGQRHEGTCLGSQLVSLREDCSVAHWPLAPGALACLAPCASFILGSLGPCFSARFPGKGAGTAQGVAAA